MAPDWAQSLRKPLRPAKKPALRSCLDRHDGPFLVKGRSRIDGGSLGHARENRVVASSWVPKHSNSFSESRIREPWVPTPFQIKLDHRMNLSLEAKGSALRAVNPFFNGSAARMSREFKPSVSRLQIKSSMPIGTVLRLLLSVRNGPGFEGLYADVEGVFGWRERRASHYPWRWDFGRLCADLLASIPG